MSIQSEPAMPFVILQIRSGAKVLKPWYGCVVLETSTVAAVFTDFSSGAIERAGSGNTIPDEYRTAFVEARVGKTKTDLTHVSPQCCVSDVVSCLGQYLEFSVAKPHTDVEDSILKSVFVKQNLRCESPIEIPYYSAGNDPICYYCGGQNELSTNTDYYPLCTSCHGKEQIHKRTRFFTPKN